MFAAHQHDDHHLHHEGTRVLTNVNEFSEKLQIDFGPPLPCPRFGKLCCAFCNGIFWIRKGPPFPEMHRFFQEIRKKIITNSATIFLNWK